MNAKEAKKLTKKSKPAADAKRKADTISWAVRTVAESKAKKAAKKAIFDKRYGLVEEQIRRACERGETTCDERTQYEDRDIKADLLAKLHSAGFTAELAGRGHMDWRTTADGGMGDEFWNEYEVIAISW